MKKHYVKAVLLLFALVLALAACAGSDGEIHEGREGLSDETGTDTYRFEVNEGAEKVDVRLQVGATAGSITWKLTDPQNALAWDGGVAAGEEMDDTRDFDAVAGEWELQFILEETSGEYDVTWSAE